MLRSAAVLFVIAMVFFGLVYLDRPEDAGPLHRTRLLMGTVVEIRVDDAEAHRFEEAVTAAFAEMERIERLMSPHIAQSEISRLSAAESGMDVSPETATVLGTALKISALSDGAFDAGLGALIKLWGFAAADPVLPDETAVRKGLAGVGQGNITLEGSRVVKRSRQVEIDLGGVAKGYAIDRAIELLAASGVAHASVNAGGDIRLLGDRNGAPWRIGIQHPRKPGEILARLALENRAVVTSGDYERSFEMNGERYHHILDPRTGYPARGCQSVTVVADTAAEADALATAAFVLGPDGGEQLLLDAGSEGIIVDAEGTIRVTPGLEEVLSWP